MGATHSHNRTDAQDHITQEDNKFRLEDKGKMMNETPRINDSNPRKNIKGNTIRKMKQIVNNKAMIEKHQRHQIRTTPTKFTMYPYERKTNQGHQIRKDK